MLASHLAVYLGRVIGEPCNGYLVVDDVAFAHQFAVQTLPVGVGHAHTKVLQHIFVCCLQFVVACA